MYELSSEHRNFTRSDISFFFAKRCMGIVFLIFSSSKFVLYFVINSVSTYPGATEFINTLYEANSRAKDFVKASSPALLD